MLANSMTTLIIEQKGYMVKGRITGKEPLYKYLLQQQSILKIWFNERHQLLSHLKQKSISIVKLSATVHFCFIMNL